MKTDSFAWHLFQTARTYLIYAVGATLFSVGISEAIHRFNDALKVFYIKDYAKYTDYTCNISDGLNVNQINGLSSDKRS